MRRPREAADHPKSANRFSGRPKKRPPHRDIPNAKQARPPVEGRACLRSPRLAACGGLSHGGESSILVTTGGKNDPLELPMSR